MQTLVDLMTFLTVVCIANEHIAIVLHTYYPFICLSARVSRVDNANILVLVKGVSGSIRHVNCMSTVGRPMGCSSVSDH